MTETLILAPRQAPLIAARFASGQKRKRLRAHLEWAFEHAALDKVCRHLAGLSEDQWYYGKRAPVAPRAAGTADLIRHLMRQMFTVGGANQMQLPDDFAAAF